MTELQICHRLNCSRWHIKSRLQTQANHQQLGRRGRHSKHHHRLYQARRCQNHLLKSAIKHILYRWEVTNHHCVQKQRRRPGRGRRGSSSASFRMIVDRKYPSRSLGMSTVRTIKIVKAIEGRLPSSRQVGEIDLRFLLIKNSQSRMGSNEFISHL